MKKSVKRLSLAAVAAAVLAAGNLPSAHAAPDVYTTPGGQILNGRLWNTTCSKYTPSVVRCKTDIWATQVSYVNGAYVARTGWTFNNLTYLPSARSMWRTNPLGRTGTWTSGGRQWRTECDTPATGRGACRTYARASVVVLKSDPYSEPHYATETRWIFNNIVQFAENGVKAVTTIPAHVIDQSRLTPSGIGPLALGNQPSDLAKLGYLRYKQFGQCWTYETIGVPAARGLVVLEGGRSGVVEVSARTNAVATSRGARVGMTVAQVQKLYGTAFKVEKRSNFATTVYIGSVREGTRELRFIVRGANGAWAKTTPLTSSDVVAEIDATYYSAQIGRGGC